MCTLVQYVSQISFLIFHLGSKFHKQGSSFCRFKTGIQSDLFFEGYKKILCTLLLLCAGNCNTAHSLGRVGVNKYRHCHFSYLPRKKGNVESWTIEVNKLEKEHVESKDLFPYRPRSWPFWDTRGIMRSVENVWNMTEGKEISWMRTWTDMTCGSD